MNLIRNMEVTVMNGETDVQIFQTLLKARIGVAHVNDMTDHTWEHIGPDTIRNEIASLYDDAFAASLSEETLNDMAVALKHEIKPLYDDLFNKVMNEYVPGVVEVHLKAKGITVPEEE